MTPLGARLKALGLTQRELGQLVGMSIGEGAMAGSGDVTVSRWARGDQPAWLASWLAMYEMLTPGQRETLKNNLSPRSFSC